MAEGERGRAEQRLVEVPVEAEAGHPGAVAMGIGESAADHRVAIGLSE